MNRRMHKRYEEFDLEDKYKKTLCCRTEQKKHQFEKILTLASKWEFRNLCVVHRIKIIIDNFRLITLKSYEVYIDP